MKSLPQINEMAGKLSLVANDENVSKLPKYPVEIAYLKECLEAGQSQKVFFQNQRNQVSAQLEQIDKAIAQCVETNKQTQRLIEILESL